MRVRVKLLFGDGVGSLEACTLGLCLFLQLVEAAGFPLFGPEFLMGLGNLGS